MYRAGCGRAPFAIDILPLFSGHTPGSSIMRRAITLMHKMINLTMGSSNDFMLSDSQMLIYKPWDVRSTL